MDELFEEVQRQVFEAYLFEKGYSGCSLEEACIKAELKNDLRAANCIEAELRRRMELA